MSQYPASGQPIPPSSPESNKLRLYLVRHGHTVYNSQGLLQGWCDSPLTAAGLADVQLTAKALANHCFVAAYSSPSGRALSTAREITSFHPRTPLTIDEGLKEVPFGDLEAMAQDQAETLMDVRRFFEDLLTGDGPGMPGSPEDASAYLARVQATFARIRAAHQDGGNVLVVSHGVTLFAYIRLACAEDSPHLANASVTIVDIDPGLGDREPATLVAANLQPDQIPVP